MRDLGFGSADGFEGCDIVFLFEDGGEECIYDAEEGDNDGGQFEGMEECEGLIDGV